MSPCTLKGRLLAIFPKFEEHWDAADNCHRLDDGPFTLCGVFAAFSEFVREEFATLPPTELQQLGVFLETCMDHPDSDLDAAAATCFLENVAGETFTAELARHLGSRARQFLSQWGA